MFAALAQVVCIQNHLLTTSAWTASLPGFRLFVLAKSSWCAKTQTKLFFLFKSFPAGDIHLLMYRLSNPSGMLTVQPSRGGSTLVLQIEEASFIFDLMSCIFLCAAGICGFYQIQRPAFNPLTSLALTPMHDC